MSGKGFNKIEKNLFLRWKIFQNIQNKFYKNHYYFRFFVQNSMIFLEELRGNLGKVLLTKLCATFLIIYW